MKFNPCIWGHKAFKYLKRLFDNSVYSCQKPWGPKLPSLPDDSKATSIRIVLSNSSITFTGERLMVQIITAAGVTASIVGFYTDATTGSQVETTNFGGNTPAWSVPDGFTATVSADSLSVVLKPTDATVAVAGKLAVAVLNLTADADISFTPDVVVTPPQSTLATSIGIRFA